MLLAVLLLPVVLPPVVYKIPGDLLADVQYDALSCSIHSLCCWPCSWLQSCTRPQAIILLVSSMMHSAAAYTDHATACIVAACCQRLIALNVCMQCSLLPRSLLLDHTRHKLE